MFGSSSPYGGSRTASPRPGNRTPRSGSLAVVDARGAGGVGGRSLTPTNFALGPGDIGGIVKRDRAIQQLVAEESAALNFLARRGSEAEKSSGEEEFFDEEAMANAERELAADAEWKRIQQNTFTRWANEHLKQADKTISDLGTDLSDGLKLISLIEVLSGKRMPRHNKKPNFRSQKLENVSIALEFLEREGVFLVNIDSTDIVDCKLKLILGLIWTLILHYAISMPMWDGPPLGGTGDQDQKTPKQRLMDWVKDKMPDCPIHNFTSDWKDGKAVGALVDSVAPGLCPNWEDWDPATPVENATEAMDLADKWLNIPKLLTPEEIVNPNVDEQSMMTYLSQFPNSRLKPGAPLRQKINENKVRAYGPGLEPTGLVANAPANFTVETFGAGDGDLVVQVVGPSGEDVNCDMVFNNDRKVTYSCSYMPDVEGEFIVNIFWSKRTVPTSPYHVLVEGFAGDASKVTAAGPGLEAEGVVINKSTFFDIFTTGAGKGIPEVIILDPKGKKDSVPLKITPSSENPETYRCEYVATMLGLHSVNVFFAGNPIPKSPFGVKVSPASLPSKVWANGRGLQPNGIRINETVSFKVYTEGAGEGDVGVKILGPGGIDLAINQSRKLGDNVTEYTYTPRKQGRHIVMITFANQEIPRSPFEVNIGPVKNSSIKAYGPGLKQGIVNKPAKFTVDTCGETGALGFSIEGPSQAKINCQDNGDGSADVDYIPTAEGEYAVHILCDKEDIPGSPFMAQIVPQTDFDPDMVKAYGPGLENGVNPKEKTHFTIDISEAGNAPLEVSIVDDLGTYEPEIKETTEKVFECTYTPRNKQHKQTILVNFGGVAVPGSPFHVLNDNPNDPSLVKVYGAGVEKGVCAGKPVEFTVDCTKSGPGHVNVNITSSKRNTVPVSIVDNKDDTYTVTYEATDAGPHKIIITLDDTEIPQSPIRLDIKPAVDLTKIALLEFEPEAFVDCINDFTVDTSGLPADQRSDIQCDISGPDGSPVDCFVNKMGPDGPYQISYTPIEVGDHEVDLRHEGKPLPDSPFPVAAIRGNNPDKVKAYGDGLEKGIVDENNYFTIETKNAGTGGLGLAMEGPSEATVQCVDNQDGSCTVDYVPSEEGDYDITIKFGDQHIAGSPFRVPCVTKDGKPKPNASKVDAYGPGLDPESVFPGKPTNFIVDASKTGEAPVDVSIENNDGSPIPNLRKPSVTDKGDGIYDVQYVPPPVGDPYEVSVKYGGIDIPGSPFEMTSSPDLKDVVGDVNKTKSGLNSRKGSELSPERNYGKNGTGLMRDGSLADGSGGSRKSSSNSDTNDRKGSNSSSQGDGSNKNANKRGSRSGGPRAEPAIEEYDIVHDESRRGSKAGGRAGIAGIDGSGLRRGSELEQDISEEGSNISGDSDDNGIGNGKKKHSGGGNGLDSRKGSSAYGNGDDSRKSSALSGIGSTGYADDEPYSRKSSEFGPGGRGSGPESRKGSGLSGPYNEHPDHDNSRKGSKYSDGMNPGQNDGRNKFGPDSRKGSEANPNDHGLSNSRKGSQGDDIMNTEGLDSRKGSKIQHGDNKYDPNSKKGHGVDSIGDENSQDASRKGSKSDSRIPTSHEGGHDNVPYGSDSRKGSYGNSNNEPDSRKGSNIGGIGDSRKGSKYGTDMEPGLRKGSGIEGHNLGQKGARKGSGGIYDDTDSDVYGDESRKSSDLTSSDGDNYGRGGFEKDDDNINRKGSNNNGRNRGNNGDPLGDHNTDRKRSGFGSNHGTDSDNDSDLESRKNSRPGTFGRNDSQASIDPNSRKGSESNSRKGSGNDGPYSGKQGDLQGPGGDRKGSNLSGFGGENSRDLDGPNSRKGSGHDGPHSAALDSLGGNRKGSNIYGDTRGNSGDLDDLTSRKGSGIDGPYSGKKGDLDGFGGDRKGSRPSGPGKENIGDFDNINPQNVSGYDGPNSGRTGPNEGQEGDRRGSKLSGPGRGNSRDLDDTNLRKGSDYDSPYFENQGEFDGPGRDRRGSKLSGPGRQSSRDLDGENSRKGSGYEDPYSRTSRDLDGPEGERRGSKASGLGRGNSQEFDDLNPRKGSGYDGPYSGRPGDDDGLEGDRRGSKTSGQGRGNSHGLDDTNIRKGSGYNDPYSGNQGGIDDQGRDRRGSKLSAPVRQNSRDPEDANLRKGSGYDDPYSSNPRDIDGTGGDRKGSKTSGINRGPSQNFDDANSRKGSGYDGPYSGRAGDPNGPESDRKGSKLSGLGRGNSRDLDDSNLRKGSGNDGPYSGNQGRSRDANEQEGDRRGSKVSGPGTEHSTDVDDNNLRKGSGYDGPYSGNQGRPGDTTGPDGDRKGSKLSGPGRENSRDLDGSNLRKGSGNDGPYSENAGDFDGPGIGRRGSKLSGPGRQNSRDLDDDILRKGSESGVPFPGRQGEFDGNEGDRRGSKLSGLGQGQNNSNSRKGSGNNGPYEGRPGDLDYAGDSNFGPDSSRRGSKLSGPNSGRNRVDDIDDYGGNDPNSRKGSDQLGNDRGTPGPYSDKRKESNLPYGRGNSKDSLGNAAKFAPLELNNIPLPLTSGNVTADIKTPTFRKNSNEMGSRKGSEVGGRGNGINDMSYGPDGIRKGSYGKDSYQQNPNNGMGDTNGNIYGDSGPNSRKGSGNDGRSGGLDSRKSSGADPDSRKGSNSNGRGFGTDSQKLSNASSLGSGNNYRKGSGEDGRSSGPNSRKSSDEMKLLGLDHPNLTDNGNGSVGVFYQPEEEGLHLLDIKQNGDHVQGSPYKFHVSPLDDGKVHAMGSGLVHAVCGDPANFVISTKGAGAGGLSLAVEGPSKAEINCQDNKDGTVNVSYLPTAPGEYKIYAKFADEHIDGSPFTCKVTGEGIKRNTISVGSSSDLTLPDNLSDYDLRALNAYIVSPSGVEEPCFLKKLPKGNNGISFTPREVGEHLVSVKRNGKHIKNSPFKIMVNREDVGDASRVKVDGETLQEGRTQQDNTFLVDTKNAGYGGLSLSVEGPSKAEIKCKDNEDGTLEVSYKPTEPGLYIVNLKFADQHIPGSPFAVAVSGEGSTKQTENINRLREAVPITEVGSQCRLTFKMPGISCSDLRASVLAPTGKMESAVVAEIEDGLYAVNFVPYELGIHTVSVMYRDVDIPGSPFQFTVGPLQDGGAHRVHAGGPGLERGIQGQAADFNVWTREAGHGSLAISVEGPSKAEVDFNDRKDGSCHVSYVVEEPGEYSVGIRFNDTHIPGSPYKVCILPSAEEAERVRLSNVADSPVSTDMPQTMLLNMNGAGGDVECKLVSPSGREDDCFITPLGTPGEHSVRFVPQEEGVHYLHAKLNGIHIPGSPFKLVVSNLTNMMNNNNGDPSSTVSVHGTGITGGVTGQASIFTIDTSDVGAGTLAITVDGPSKVDLSCNETDEGYEVAYQPMVPGKYFVTVKYNGNNIKGSPFSVQITGDNLNTSSREESMQRKQSKRSSVTMETMSRTSYVRHQYSESRRGTIQGTASTNINTNNNILSSSLNYDRRRSSAIPDFGNSQASQVKCSGFGIESAKSNRHNSFSVDCSKAGNNILYVGVYGPETPCEEVVIKHKGSKRYSVDYVVKERGQYIIFVKWGDDHVAGSPFHIDAN